MDPPATPPPSNKRKDIGADATNASKRPRYPAEPDDLDDRLAKRLESFKPSQKRQTPKKGKALYITSPRRGNEAGPFMARDPSNRPATSSPTSQAIDRHGSTGLASPIPGPSRLSSPGSSTRLVATPLQVPPLAESTPASSEGELHVVQTQLPTPDATPVRPREPRQQSASDALRELFAVREDKGVRVGSDDTRVPGLNLVLKDYQALDRSWMRRRESGVNKGGLVCYDVGLGKTVLMLALFLDQFKPGQMPTLYITEPSVIEQTAYELTRHTPGLKVLIYYGPGRTLKREELLEYHIVMTTYDTVTAEFKNLPAGPVHALDKRVKERTRDDRKLKPADHHGIGPDDVAEHFGRRLRSKIGVVKDSPSTRKSGLRTTVFELFWERVVLDEGHKIRNAATGWAQACSSLLKRFSWVMTATPVQNSAKDLYSYCKFIGIPNWEDWDWFRGNVLVPLESKWDLDAGIERLKDVLTDHALVRRKGDRLNGALLVKLPKFEVIAHALEFSAGERAEYMKRARPARSMLERLEKNNHLSEKDRNCMLARITMLRQTCNHLQLPKSKRYPVQTEREEDDTDAALSATGDPADDSVELTQGMEDTTDNRDPDELADPRKRVVVGWPNKTPELTKVTKVVELVKGILALPPSEIEDDSGTRRMPHKIIIFSQWNMFLDLLDTTLAGSKISCLRLNGSLRVRERNFAINDIRTSKTKHVILITTSAGSAGIDLSCCNHVISCDPWWNPAREDQAFGRAHRIGQVRPVLVHKLTVRDTIEDGMLELQKRKRDFAEIILEGTTKGDETRWVRDVKTLLMHTRRNDIGANGSGPSAL